MNTTTHEQLEQLISSEGAALSAFCTTLLFPVSYVHMFIGSCYLTYALRRFMTNIDRLDQACVVCQKECKFPYQDNMRSMRNTLQEILGRSNASKDLPFFFRATALKTIERLDDKLENYALSSDAELKSLVAALSEKIDNHAAK